jgi:hypothetical protein
MRMQAELLKEALGKSDPATYYPAGDAGIH